MNIRIVTLSDPDQDIAYIDELMSLVENAKEANAVPYLYPQERDFFERNLRGETINTLAFDDEKIVGYAALRKMDPWPNYLEPTEFPPMLCALMLFNLVDPRYRGQGIGKRLSTERVAAAKRARFKHLFSTIHPDNKPSLGVLKNLGFTVIAQKPMFSNQLMRKLLYLELR